MAKAPTKTKKADPFKTRKTRESQQEAGDVITPPHEIAEAVDAFREYQEQAKHFEGEATVQKDLILDFGQDQYAKRVLKGMNSSFKIMGDQSMVTFVAMDVSSGLTEEEVAAFAERWGQKAADDLIQRDFGSIRFNAEVLEANYETVVEALQTLPKDVLENLFKTMLMKAKPGSVEKAKKYAKGEAEFKELLGQLKIRQYIR